jgi:hypothetical protein
MTNTARNELRDALARRAAAESAQVDAERLHLEAAAAAAAATGRALSLLEAIVLEGETLDHLERREAEARLEKVREAVRTGSQLPFDKAAAKTASREELAARRIAVERVVVELRSAEVFAGQDVEDAKVAVANAMQTLLTQEAHAEATP